MSSTIEDDILKNVVQIGMVFIISEQEKELTALREQVKVLREALEEVRLILSKNKITTGICTCGGPIRGHGAWSYHVPRDSGHEITDYAINTINTALNREGV